MNSTIYLILDAAEKRYWSVDGWGTGPGQALTFGTSEEAWGYVRINDIPGTVFEYVTEDKPVGGEQ